MWIWIDLLFGIILFLLITFIGRFFLMTNEFSSIYSTFSFKSKEMTFYGNFVLNVLFPSAFIAILAAVWQSLKLIFLIDNIWIIVVYYWLIRFLFTAVLLNRFRYMNHKYEISCTLLSTGLALCVYFWFIMGLLEANTSIFIPLDEFRNALWYAIIVFVASLFWKVIKTGLSDKQLYPEIKRRRMIRKRYYYFKKKYGEHINNCIEKSKFQLQFDNENENIELLVIAIMIYEDFNSVGLSNILDSQRYR